MSNTCSIKILIFVSLLFNLCCLSEEIRCSASECFGQDIHCNDSSTDHDCVIQCDGDASCQESTVFCAPNKHCNVGCSSAFSCKQMTVHCPISDKVCNIHGIGRYSLHSLEFNCYESVCSVTCDGDTSCFNATLNAKYPGAILDVVCNNTVIYHDACKNIHLYCPPNKEDTKQCHIKGSAENIWWNIYAINSWDDIDLMEYSTNTAANLSQMHCGTNLSTMCSVHFDENNNEWNCANHSSLCYVRYDNYPSKDEPDADRLAIALSIGAFFLLIIALCIGLYLKKDEEIFAEEYEAKKVRSPSVSQASEKTETEAALMRETETDFKEYKKMMQLIFYTFAGYQPWAKKRQLYMNKKELQTFLDIVNIQDPVEEVLKLIDSDVEDGTLTLNEWMDYFVDKNVNPNIMDIKHHIESQVTWSLLCKSLKIFEMIDTNHTGTLEYGEFQRFGATIGLNQKETEILWNTMDTNESGTIDIVELFEWFRLRLYQQKGRISASKQPSLLCSKSDLCDLEDFRSNAKRLSIHTDKT